MGDSSYDSIDSRCITSSTQDSYTHCAAHLRMSLCDMAKAILITLFQARFVRIARTWREQGSELNWSPEISSAHYRLQLFHEACISENPVGLNIFRKRKCLHDWQRTKIEVEVEKIRGSLCRNNFGEQLRE
jgi:hypothetical protein